MPVNIRPTKEEQEELLVKSRLYLSNRYWVTTEMRRIFELEPEIHEFTIEEVWQMTHTWSGKKSTMLHIRWNTGTSDHQPLDFIEKLVFECP